MLKKYIISKERSLNLFTDLLTKFNEDKTIIINKDFYTNEEIEPEIKYKISDYHHNLSILELCIEDVPGYFIGNFGFRAQDSDAFKIKDVIPFILNHGIMNMSRKIEIHKESSVDNNIIKLVACLYDTTYEFENKDSFDKVRHISLTNFRFLKIYEELGIWVDDTEVKTIKDFKDFGRILILNFRQS